MDQHNEAKMSIISMKNSTMLHPAEETPRKILWLPRLDMIVQTPHAHNKTLFIYNHVENPKKGTAPTFFDVATMKESLSKVLVPFYPMAGRLRLNENNGRYEIDCNAKGALFIEAEATNHALVDLGDEFRPNDELRQLMVPTCDYTKGVSSFPLLMVQLTRFKCGGVCLGFLQHHHVADGSGHVHFINSWARVAKGLDLAIMPVHDRALHLGPRDPPEIKFRHLEYEPSLPPLIPKDFSGKICTSVERMFKVSKEQIHVLKQQATSQDTLKCKFTTFEVLAAHVWRSACNSRGFADDQDVKLNMPIDGRPRLNLPPGYCGNVIFHATCNAKAGDIIHKPLSYVSNKVHEALSKRYDAEYLRSAIDYLESQPKLEPLIRGAHTVICPNLSINSWAKFSFDEMDFGWGKPTFTRHGGIKLEGHSFFVPSLNGDGSLSLAIRLFRPHMDLFRKHFYEMF